VVIISIAAGITIASLERQLGSETAVVRCMPNTPALLRQGASALYANAATAQSQRDMAAAILGAVGTVCWLEDEAQMDAVTAISGSGPAYFFLLMEAMVAAGEKLGLGVDTTHRLVVQTALGAARMAAESNVELAELRRRVTSPGGTTAAALSELEAAAFSDIVDAAVRAASDRSRQLAAEMG
jgi:pyrroline-5-carboxylate reductase